MRSSHSLLILLTLVSAACSANEGVFDGVEQATFDGTNVNGTNVNGTNVNGTNVNGTNVNGGTLGGASLHDVHLEGSEIVAYAVNGGELRGEDLVGAKFDATLSDGGNVKLRIDGVSQGTGSKADVFYYTVKRKTGPNSWAPLCPTTAIAITGAWSYDQGTPGDGGWVDQADTITFGCMGAAIAKCIEMGYEPWSSAGGQSLAGHHEACVRMLRGDFCGDGIPYTIDGSLVNVYDGHGIQQDDRWSWLIEAEWDANGARCFSPNNRAHEWVPCFVPKLSLTCGAFWHFGTGSLLITETPTL